VDFFEGKIKKLLHHQDLSIIFAAIFNAFFIEFSQTSALWKDRKNKKKLKTKILSF